MMNKQDQIDFAREIGMLVIDMIISGEVICPEFYDKLDKRATEQGIIQDRSCENCINKGTDTFENNPCLSCKNYYFDKWQEETE